MWILGWVCVAWAARAAGGEATRPHFTREPPARVLWAATRGARAECRASGQPPPVVQWVAADGVPLATIPGLRHVLSDGTLVLAARKSLLDAGGSVLRCRATNSAGAVLSRAVLLQPVEDSALVHTVRQLGAARVGRELSLRCEAAAALSAADLPVAWLRDSVPISALYLSADSRWIAGAGGVLLGRELTASDLAAEYSCVVAGYASAPYRIATDEVSEGSQPELSSIEARVGDTVVLPCLADLASDARVVWQREEHGRSLRVPPDTRGAALVISPARAHHAGIYSCAPSGGDAQRAARALQLTVTEPLAVTLEPSPMMVSTGGVGRFNCTVSGGRGTATVTWEHEGRPLSHQPHQVMGHSANYLDVGPIRAHHVGLYQCTAIDHHDTAVAEAELVIADSPPRLLSTFGEALARAGQTVSLRCSAAGEPPPRILWSLDGRPLNTATNKYIITTTPGGDGSVVSWLNISVTGPEEGGRYSCNATSVRGFSAHHSRVNVIGPPYIRFIPPIHVTADADITLYCPYSGYPIKDVIWVREDGSKAESSSADIGERLDKGELKLSSVRASSAGGYTCEVRSDTGELARRTLHLLVHKQPKIASFQFPEDVEVGGGAQATCSLVSGDKPVHFTWLKDDLPISSAMKVEQKNMDFFSILIISEVTSTHSGMYTCRVTNAVGTASHSTQLFVKEAPTWRYRAQNTSVSAGAALLLPCSATGFPQPQISWEYSTDQENWRPVTRSGAWSGEPADDEPAVLADGAAWIRGAQARHEGWYRCSARAPHHAPLHHVFYLDVNEPPRLSRNGGPSQVWVVRGSAARVACAARGEHALRLHWTHNHNVITDEGGISVRESTVDGEGLVSELTVDHTEPHHAGEYRCRAHNPYGIAELIFTLLVKERPSPPKDLRVSELESRRARVSWLRARGHVTHYTLQLRAASHEHELDSWERDVVNLTVTRADLLITTEDGLEREGVWLRALTPHAAYAVRAAAANDVGVSSHCPALHFNTRSEAPGAPPRDVVVRALRPREFHVSWQAPPRETLHGPLMGYTVRWWEAGDGSPQADAAEANARADATGATLRGLRPATRYAVAVAAYNDVGAGPPSPPQHHHTLESPPWGTPEGLSCLSEGPSTLRVTWRPPPHDTQGGRLTHYTLQYVRREPNALPLTPSREALVRSQGTEAVISRLTPHAQYEVRVRAHTAAGDGPLCAPALCRTDEDVPSAPAGMKLVALGERALRASWLPPAEPNGVITHYSLYVRDLAGSREPNVTRVGVESAETEVGNAECMKALRGLRPGRTYEAWARAATVVGEGPPSVTVACQPSALAPARISSFGGAVVSAAGDTVALRCVVGGSPPPAKRWLRAGAALQPRPPYYLDGDSLSIRGLDTAHADNYTCVAENPHGSDSATWRVVVLRPPPAPSLALVSARARELELELRPAAHLPGHAPARAYTLHWKLDAADAEWRTEPSAPGPVVLRGLRCGSPYLAYASAGGAPSPEISARTAGGAPRAPPDARWIETNATAARLDAGAWDDGGCGAVSLRLEWAGAGGGGAREAGAALPVVLGGLVPATWYRLAARAVNEAGVTRALYEFATLTLGGARLADSRDVADAFPATAGESALLLALCAALSVAALTIVLILVRRKRPTPGGARAATECGDKAGGCGTYRAPAHTPAKLPDPPEVYEISPYATFAGTGSGSASRAYTLQLRALSRHDDDAAPPPPPSCCEEETCLSACDREAQRRRRRRHHHYYPDHGCSQDSGS